VVGGWPDASFFIAAFGRVVAVNPAAVALAGRTRGQLIGRRVRDLMDTSEIVEVGPGGLVLDDICVAVLRSEDLRHGELGAAGVPAVRLSKRLQDLADAEALIETNPDLAKHLAEEERAILDRLPR